MASDEGVVDRLLQAAGVPPGAQVRFDIDLLDVKSRRLADELREVLVSQGVAGATRVMAREEAMRFADTYVSEADLRRLAGELSGRGAVKEEALVRSLMSRLYPAADANRK